MATGKEIEERGHIVGFQEEIDNSLKKSEDAFFTWFNSSNDANEAFIRGNWDLAFHILEPIKELISYPEKLSVLEIGYGGGRIISAASRFFNRAVGIDIHNQNNFVKAELEKRGIDNVQLFQTDGKKIPVDDNSIDIVYSFIVLQHVEKIEIFRNYIEETYRILKPGGLAVLYFGRETKFSKNKESKLLYLIDKNLENLTLKNGYKEIPAKVNEINLIVSLDYAMKLAKSLKFKVLKTLVSRRKLPDGFNIYGGQNGLVLKK